MLGISKVKNNLLSIYMLNDFTSQYQIRVRFASGEFRTLCYLKDHDGLTKNEYRELEKNINFLKLELL